MTKDKAIDIIEEVLNHKAQAPIRLLHTIWCSPDIFKAMAQDEYKGLAIKTSHSIQNEEYMFISTKYQME